MAWYSTSHQFLYYYYVYDRLSQVFSLDGLFGTVLC